MHTTPREVRLLVVLLAAAAVVTVLVESLNWWLTPDAGYALFVRTTWALLRSLGFLVLIWHVRRGRAGAAPFAVILCVTTIFALGRLVTPRDGYPQIVGVLGFLLVVVLCLAILGLFYRSPAVRAFLTKARRQPLPGWLVTTRVAAFSYSPLMLVAATVAVGQIFAGRLEAVPAVVMWFVAAIALSYATLFATYFLVRGKRWARALIIGVTLLVLAIHLPLCWWLLGLDGLVRDGVPVLAAAALALGGLWRTRNPAETLSYS